MKDLIVVENLGKKFRRYHVDRPWSLQEAALRGLCRIRPVDYFWALRGLNFSVPQGRMVGVIGPNGAGKSTLLQLIGGVLRPDEGQVKTRGQIGALLDLGAGFHPDLTGRENVFVSGVIGGLTRREVVERFDAIVAFSELEEFIDSPLRTYSSGMQMRLAFAVAVHVEPEVLLIDEVLSVGDLSFQTKSFERISYFKAKGCTIILVSHAHEVIRELCDEALWLNWGRLMARGPAGLVVDQYVAATEAGQRSFGAAPVVRGPYGAAQ
jgi:lipopolysaccharide transport system ATP-binding protein